jgi:ABC-type iron transport system FetAB permease component
MLDFNPLFVLGASLSLVAVAVGVSLYLKLGFERSIVVASLRAAVQLGAVGLLLAILIDSDWEQVIAAVWVLSMIGIFSMRAHSRCEVPVLETRIKS